VGCRFYPRCPYEPAEAAENHPELTPAQGDLAHTVRCFLPAETRRRIWDELKQGKTPDQVKQSLGAPTGAA
jgi:hypothetical protein